MQLSVHRRVAPTSHSTLLSRPSGLLSASSSSSRHLRRSCRHRIVSVAPQASASASEPSSSHTGTADTPDAGEDTLEGQQQLQPTPSTAADSAELSDDAAAAVSAAAAAVMAVLARTARAPLSEAAEPAVQQQTIKGWQHSWTRAWGVTCSSGSTRCVRCVHMSILVRHLVSAAAVDIAEWNVAWVVACAWHRAVLCCAVLCLDCCHGPVHACRAVHALVWLLCPDAC
jgi:hypothetical protein